MSRLASTLAFASLLSVVTAAVPIESRARELRCEGSLNLVTQLIYNNDIPYMKNIMLDGQKVEDEPARGLSPAPYIGTDILGEATYIYMFRAPYAGTMMEYWMHIGGHALLQDAKYLRTSYELEVKSAKGEVTTSGPCTVTP